MSSFDLDEWTNLGNILLREGALSRDQLARALAEQERRKEIRLGELLVELKICSREEIDAALEQQAHHRLPPPSGATERAQATLRAALGRVRHETDKLERSSSSVAILKVSPGEP